MIELNEFISKYVTKREKSMFLSDIESHKCELYNNIHKKCVLVIGGAGSIGSQYIKSILKYEPKSLTIVDINENGLAELTRDLRSSSDIVVPDSYITYAMDYASPMFNKMFVNHGKYDIVANFSAHKHVRSEKDIISVEALIRNNLLNAKKLLDILKIFPPDIYFCVSTDKAANPVNIMGASKRLMEDLIFSYSDYFPVKTARFANVAFSNGSLPDGFLYRIKKKQPLCAPSDVLRYFVSPEESGQICMLASVLGKNREIFYPKLKEKTMMSFMQIAKDLVISNGYTICECENEMQAINKALELKAGGREYPVYFSKSDTSGEKEYEEFYIDSEKTDETRFKGLGVIIDKQKVSIEKVQKLFESFYSAFSNENVTKDDIIQIIKGYLPGFMHIEKGKSSDEKM